MSKGIILIFLIWLGSLQLPAFGQAQDTLYLMNGHVIGQKVIDTLLGAVTIDHPEKPGKRLHYEADQLYMVRYANGNKRYYYVQDSALNNWFTRDEMWLYMKGEVDARKGFKPWGSIIGAGLAGILGGMTGTFWGPIAPYTYMALSGIPKVKIQQGTVSHPALVESDAYLLGYERVARQKRKIQSLISGSIGLTIGYGIYVLFHERYPESANFGFRN
jgi:hypothetical protein